MGEFVGSYWLEPITPKPNAYYYIPKATPLTYIANDGKIYKIDCEFETDLASVPRKFWGFRGLGPADYIRPAILHDWLYQSHHLGNDLADFTTSNRLLYESLRAEKCGRLLAYFYFKFTELFGMPVWNGEESSYVG